MPFFVQFPHPGAEHTPKPPTVGTVMDWNVGDHKRKFLRADGEYVLDGRRRSGPLGFWGEWEAPSRIVDVWPKDDHLPSFLHEPLYRAPTGPSYQNTDPLVFGDQFLYTNCKELNNQKLRKLTSGSVILFGSKKDGGFVLDTVFVIGDEPPRPYEQGETGVLPDNPLADAVVFRPLQTTKDVGKACVAYMARMHQSGIDGPYSFVPSRPDGEGMRFGRPALEPTGELAGLIEPNLAMGSRVLELPAAQLEAVWHHIVDVCDQHALARGVRVTAPSVSDAPTSVPHDAGRPEPRGGC